MDELVSFLYSFLKELSCQALLAIISMPILTRFSFYIERQLGLRLAHNVVKANTWLEYSVERSMEITLDQSMTFHKVLPDQYYLRLSMGIDNYHIFGGKIK